MDDTRESLAETIIERLDKHGYEFQLSDYNIKEFHLPLKTTDELIKWADIVMVATLHAEYKNINTNKPVIYCSQ